MMKQTLITTLRTHLENTIGLLLWKWTAVKLRFVVMEMDCSQTQVCCYGNGLQSNSGL